MNNNESVEINNITENENISFFGVLPVLPLRENPVFPKMVIHFNVGRNKSLNAVDEAMVKNRNILLLAQKGPDKEIITADDLYTVGTLAEIGLHLFHLSLNAKRMCLSPVSFRRMKKLFLRHTCVRLQSCMRFLFQHAAIPYTKM